MKLIRKIKYPLTIFLFIIVICLALYLKKNLNEKKYNNLEEEEEILIEDSVKEEQNSVDICNVDIKGAVKNPNVYQVSCDYTVNDAIKVAGGVTNDADTSVINLAKKITNEMVVIVYTKDEVKNSNIVDTVVKVVEKECVCPNIQNDSCINTEIEDSIGNDPTSNDSLININTATSEKLQELPGIGESKAKAIINYRKENGNFKSIEDLLNVDGIGNNLYEQIKIYITT